MRFVEKCRAAPLLSAIFVEDNDIAAYSVAAEGLMLMVGYGGPLRAGTARERRFGESGLRYVRAACDRQKQSSRMKGLR
jgi:hypothetical protein